jgi:hypothetical protein
MHQTLMVKTNVPIHYGLMPVTPMYEASVRLFPHAQDSVNPGCMIETPKWATIYNCPACVEARRLWELSYSGKR